jgi:hypothetical protein
MRRQVSGALPPSDEIAPTPVTATRRGRTVGMPLLVSVEARAVPQNMQNVA